MPSIAATGLRCKIADMPSVYRTTAVWTGFTGSPGYTKFSWSGLSDDTTRNAAGAAMRSFFLSLQAFFHSTWTISVSPIVQEFDAATSQLLSEVSMSATPAAVAGSGTPAAFAGGSGICIIWKTGYVLNGRRLNGRTFLVPVAGNAFENDGTPTASALTSINSACTTLIAASSDFCVWGKTFTKPVPPAKPVQIGGVAASVTSAVVKDSASQLRSRRR